MVVLFMLAFEKGFHLLALVQMKRGDRGSESQSVHAVVARVKHKGLCAGSKL